MNQPATTDAMRDLNLHYLAGWKVLVCLLCKGGLNFDNATSKATKVFKHFRQVHHTNFSDTDRAYLKDLLEEYVIAPSDNTSLANKQRPLEVLSSHPGFQCKLCDKAERHLVEILNHLEKEHDAIRDKSNYSPCLVQSLFLRPILWIQVDARAEHRQLSITCDRQDATSGILQELANATQALAMLKDSKAVEVEKSRHGVDMTPFLSRMQWTTYFANADMKKKVKMSSMPLANNSEWSLVLATVDQLFNQFNATSKNMSDTVRHHLPSAKLEQSIRPWHLLQYDTIIKYLQTWKRYLCFLLRLKIEDIETDKMYMTGELATAISDWKRISHEHTDDNATLIRCILQLSCKSFLYEANIPALRHPLHSFLAHQAWNQQECRFQAPHEYRHVSSGLIWCCRAIFYMSIYGIEDSDTEENISDTQCDTPDDGMRQLEQFKQDQLKYMVLGCAAPMEEILSRHNYSKAAGTDTSKKRQVVFEGDSVNLDGTLVSLPSVMNR